MAGENDNSQVIDGVNHLSVGEGGVGVAGEAVPSAAERSLLQKVIRKGLIENKNDTEIQRKDPNSPLYSVKSFEALNLKPALLKGNFVVPIWLRSLCCVRYNYNSAFVMEGTRN